MNKGAPGSGGSDPGTAIAAIWARHRDDALGRVTALEDAVAALLENRLTAAERRAAERDAHRLAGSAGTFGFLQASESARQLEWIFGGTDAVPAAAMLRAADEVVALRTAFDAGPPPAPANGPPAAKTTPTDTGPRHRAVKQERLVGAAAAPGRRNLVLNNPAPAMALTPSSGVRGRAAGLPPGAPADGATVFLVDEDPAVLVAAAAVLGPAGLRVVGLEDPVRFWTAFQEEQPDLVILDLGLPQGSGEELCRAIRGDVDRAGLPVLFLTAGSDPATVSAVFAAGADDFVAKPFSGPELLARVQNRLERTWMLRALVDTDPLTGLANRRRAEPDLQLLLGLADRHSQPLSIAMLDLDGFKDVDDHHGVPMGDTVLRHIGSLLRQSFRREDVVARWDEHKFLLGMHGMAREDGRRIMASLLEALREESFVTPSGSPLPVSFNAGIATYPGDATTVAGLCEAAGRAMQRTKRTRAGRALPPSTLKYNADVVVVEDDNALAELLEHALTTRGHRFRHLADGQAAVDQLACTAPALRTRVLLLDVNLPVINGFGVLRQMAAAGTLSGTRVIMLTARSSEKEVIEALELGAFDHVAKPFSVPVLMQRISRALGT